MNGIMGQQSNRKAASNIIVMTQIGTASIIVTPYQKGVMEVSFILVYIKPTHMNFLNMLGILMYLLQHMSQILQLQFPNQLQHNLF